MLWQQVVLGRVDTAHEFQGAELIAAMTNAALLHLHKEAVYVQFQSSSYEPLTFKQNKPLLDSLIPPAGGARSDLLPDY